MINVLTIKENLSAGLLVLSKIGNAYACSKKMFDPETGKEVSPEVEALDIVDLEAQKIKLLESAGQIEFLIVQLKSLK